MYLFILESIGTPELILIGIIALMFLGPRKLPEMAKKAGKIMSEFRGTAAEFKETWQREVNFEEEAKAFSLDELEEKPIPRGGDEADYEPATPPLRAPEPPVITEADPARFEHLRRQEQDPKDMADETATPTKAPDNDKKTWL
ncbi:MAG: twin-arginine translocase TatA/TatE family subunit [Pyrinomonadaceae bacterium]